jgi:hypothetical protein
MLKLTRAEKTKNLLLWGLNFPGYDANCVFVRRKFTTDVRGIDLRELSAEKKDLR